MSEVVDDNPGESQSEPCVKEEPQSILYYESDEATPFLEEEDIKYEVLKEVISQSETDDEDDIPLLSRLQSRKKEEEKVERKRVRKRKPKPSKNNHGYWKESFEVRKKRRKLAKARKLRDELAGVIKPKYKRKPKPKYDDQDEDDDDCSKTEEPKSEAFHLRVLQYEDNEVEVKVFAASEDDSLIPKSRTRRKPERYQPRDVNRSKECQAKRKKKLEEARKKAQIRQQTLSEEKKQELKQREVIRKLEKMARMTEEEIEEKKRKNRLKYQRTKQKFSPEEWTARIKRRKKTKEQKQKEKEARGRRIARVGVEEYSRRRKEIKRKWWEGMSAERQAEHKKKQWVQLKKRREQMKQNNPDAYAEYRRKSLEYRQRHNAKVRANRREQKAKSSTAQEEAEKPNVVKETTEGMSTTTSYSSPHKPACTPPIMNAEPQPSPLSSQHELGL